MKTEQEIKQFISELKDEKTWSNRDDIDKENINDEIKTLNWVLEIGT